MSQWYYIDSATNQQAADEGTLIAMYRSNQINDETYVWSETVGGDWAPINQLPDLLAKLKPPAASTMPQPSRPAPGGLGASIAAQAAQNKKLGPMNSNALGAPAPVSTGTDNRALNIVKRQEPSHGWKVCLIEYFRPCCFLLLLLFLFSHHPHLLS